MRGYQSIPSAAVESGAAPGDGGESDAPSSSSSAPPPPSAFDSPSLAAKVGYVSLGVIVGVAASGGLPRWGPIAPSGAPAGAIVKLGAPPMPSSPSSAAHHHRAIVNGKSFIDSLPFEDVDPAGWNPAQPRVRDPLAWNPAQPRPREEGVPSISVLGAAGSSNRDGDGGGGSLSDILSAIKEETPLLSASILGGGGGSGAGGGGSGSNSSPSSPSSSSSAAPSPPHLLYHAHQSSFGLLYDPSKSSNYYISEYGLDYFLINSGGFDAQINQAYCGVATVATVLNSLKYAKRFRDGDDMSGWSFDLPVDPRYEPYPYATQRDILAGDCVWDTVIERGDGSGTGGERGSDVDGVFKPPYGLGLEQAGKLLRCHAPSDQWDVTVQEVDPSKLTLARMRYDLKSALIDPDARVMINYDRKGLGQVGGGHFSPLGAYHAATDSFLVMDVAKYKYPPVWVGADTLYGAMATVDRCGTWDYPRGQERLADNASDGRSSRLFNPITPEEYAASLAVLNCRERMRGYIVLRKKA